LFIREHLRRIVTYRNENQCCNAYEINDCRDFQEIFALMITTSPFTGKNKERAKCNHKCAIYGIGYEISEQTKQKNEGDGHLSLSNMIVLV
jgi:hypothetical protein